MLFGKPHFAKREVSVIPKLPGIYKIENFVNGRVYAGSAVNLNNRWAVHRHSLERGKHHSIKLQRAWKKHGAGSFSFSVIELVDDKNVLIEREQFWLDALRCAKIGYNVLPVAGSSAGRKFKPETLQKMSEQRKGRLHTDETKAKMSASRKGKKKTPEHRAKIGESQKGKIISAETREKMSAATKARNRLSDGSFPRHRDCMLTLRLNTGGDSL